MASRSEAAYLATLPIEPRMLMNKRKSQRRNAQKAREGKAEPAMPDKSAGMTEYIGHELRAMFDGVVAEPVPDRFHDLLAELEEKQAKD
jgi:hypothetical protein